MLIGTMEFSKVWVADFEFCAPPGERPRPICLVARELGSAHTIRLFGDALTSLTQAPFGIGANSLFIAYYASAELGCFLAMGWQLPTNVLDLFAEFRVLTNGRQVPNGAGLLGALSYFGLPCLDIAEKEAMRLLAVRGPPFTEGEALSLLDYCQTDVDALQRLLPKMNPRIETERALLRGRYMRAAAHIEHTGVPLDRDAVARLGTHWPHIKSCLIEHIDASFGVYDGGSFKTARFAKWLQSNGVPWPQLESGALDLGDDTFKEMSCTYPQLMPLRDLRHALASLRLHELAVGADGRNRCLLSAFQARRNLSMGMRQRVSGFTLQRSPSFPELRVC